MWLFVSSESPGEWLVCQIIRAHAATIYPYSYKHSDSYLCCPRPLFSTSIRPALSQTREYFVAAEEVVWDYAPFNGEMCGGTLVPFSDNAKTFVEPGPDKIGRKYIKALYVEYTDATFKEKKVWVSLWRPIFRMLPRCNLG